MDTWLPKQFERWCQCIDILHASLQAGESVADASAAKTVRAVAVAEIDSPDLVDTTSTTAAPTQSSEHAAEPLSPAESDLENELAEIELPDDPVDPIDPVAQVIKESAVLEESLQESDTGEPPPAQQHHFKHQESEKTEVFFSAIPWTGQFDEATEPVETEPKKQTPKTPVQRPVNKISPPSTADLDQVTASSFLSSLPWTGSHEEPEEISSIHVSAHHTDEGLDPREADFEGANLLSAGLLSAARTSDKFSKKNSAQVLVGSPETMNTESYFTAIPWHK